MGTAKGRNGGTLNKWDKGQSGNPNGRPPKFISTLKRVGFKKAEIDGCLEVLLSMTVDELKEVFMNQEATILEKTIAKALHKDLNGGRLDALETILNRTYGKPVAKTEVTGSNGTPLVPVNVVVRDSETAKALERLKQGENN
jgi:hypothetical protein